MNPKNTVFDAKRLIGRRFGDSAVKEDMAHWPFTVKPGPGDKPMIEVEFKGESKTFSPEEISAMILVKMKETAEAFLGKKVKRAVITGEERTTIWSLQKQFVCFCSSFRFSDFFCFLKIIFTCIVYYNLD